MRNGGRYLPNHLFDTRIADYTYRSVLERRYSKVPTVLESTSKVPDLSWDTSRHYALGQFGRNILICIPTFVSRYFFVQYHYRHGKVPLPKLGWYKSAFLYVDCAWKKTAYPSMLFFFICDQHFHIFGGDQNFQNFWSQIYMKSTEG